MSTYIYNYKNEQGKPNVRELTLINGISFPSDSELIMLILGKGTKNASVEDLSEDVLKTINASNEDNLINNLLKIDGIGESRALAVAAALELGKRRKCHTGAILKVPKDVLPFIQHYSLSSTEHFIAVSVNGSNEIINTHVISIGSSNRAIIHPREIFGPLITENASGVIVCHNHPGGQLYPSNADIESTKILKDAATILGICLMDHIIFTQKGYFSFMEHNLLKED